MNEILKKRIDKAADLHIGFERGKGMDINTYMRIRSYQEGAYYALTHQWVSVDEALPEYDETVIVAWYNGDYCFNHRSNDTNVKTDKYGFCDYGVSEVVAWMPIPELNLKYKEE